MPDEATSPPPAEKPRRKPLDYLSRSWRLIAGSVGTIAAIVGLVFVFFPEAKPTVPEGCKAQGVELPKVVARGSVTYRAFLARRNASRRGLPRERLNEVGELISFDIETKGYVKQQLVVATRVLGADQAPVEELGLENPRQLVLMPEKCEDSAHREVWSALPSKPGRYTVELRVLDPRGEELRVEETQEFTT